MSLTNTNTIIYTRDFPTATCQNAFCNKGIALWGHEPSCSVSGADTIQVVQSWALDKFPRRTLFENV